MKSMLRLLIITLLSTLISSYKASAQSGEVVIKSDGDLTKAVIDSLKYVLPEFEQGTIFFKRSPKVEAVLNISTIMPCITFIQKGDTLILSKEMEDNVALVMVGERLWRKKIGYVEVIDAYSDIELGIERRLVFEQPKKQGAYGYASETAAVDAVDRIGPEQIGLRFTDRYVNVPYKYTNTIFIINGDKRVIPTKNVFKKSFPGKEKEIDRYLKENKVDFRRVGDVQKLFNYCKEL